MASTCHRDFRSSQQRAALASSRACRAAVGHPERTSVRLVARYRHATLASARKRQRSPTRWHWGSALGMRGSSETAAGTVAPPQVRA